MTKNACLFSAYFNIFCQLWMEIVPPPQFTDNIMDEKSNLEFSNDEEERGKDKNDEYKEETDAQREEANMDERAEPTAQTDR